MAHNLLTRRRLIGAAGLGMAGIVSGPLRAAVKPAFRWQDEAAGAAAPIAAACVNHPFVRGLADGSLSEERFLYYLGQNIHYLVNYRRALSALAKRLKNPAHRRQFEAWAEETAATERYTRDCFIRANPKQPDVLPISPTTQLYMGWEAQAASFLPVHEAVGAMLPCFWSYGEVGRFVARTKKTEDNPYAEWIAGYGDPAYAGTVDRAMGIGSEIAETLKTEERLAMTAAFLRSNRLEWMFWTPPGAWKPGHRSTEMRAFHPMESLRIIIGRTVALDAQTLALDGA